jgi:hypothetical protein
MIPEWEVSIRILPTLLVCYAEINKSLVHS